MDQFIYFDLSSAWDELLYLWKNIWGNFIVLFNDQHIDFYTLFYSGVIVICLYKCFSFIFDWGDDHNDYDPDDDVDY